MSKIKALVLAAGLSSRMAENKLLLTLGHKSILQRTVDSVLAAGITDITVVLGHMREEVEAALAGYALNYAYNPDYAEGMGTSLRTGARKIICEKDFDAVLLFNGDTPFIKQETIKLIIKKYEDTGALVVMPYCAGKRGHPVLLSGRLLPELLDIAGDVGARQIIGRHQEETQIIEINDCGIYEDIDSPEEYRLYQERFRENK